MTVFANRLNIGLIFLLLISMIFASCGGDTGKSSKVTNEQLEIIRDYQQMKLFGQAGNVKEFLNMRDSVTNEEIRRYYMNWGFVMDSARVVKMSNNWPDLTGLPIVEDSTLGRWRRLLLDRGDFTDTREVVYAIYNILILGKNGEDWKISNITMVRLDKYNPDGSLRERKETLYPKLFRLPPDFSDLKQTKKEYEQKMEEDKPIPIDPKELPGNNR